MSNLEFEQRLNLMDMLYNYQCKVKHPEMNQLNLWFNHSKGIYHAEKDSKIIEIILSDEEQKRIMEPAILENYYKFQEIKNKHPFLRTYDDEKEESFIRENFTEIIGMTDQDS